MAPPIEDRTDQATTAGERTSSWATDRPIARHRSGEWPTVRDRLPRRTTLGEGRADKSRWHWLLLVPIVLPLMPVIYNRVDPTLLGMPFFYWCQLGFAFLASGVIAFVHKKVG
ncbi:DUF3311 domain-containing protein [Paractinoplanes ovalisporus]|uniref:DUF3311 domain-containing protein n=1 Tax=Paractinoplanes ovalisporus TaxID=2810368 RepID=UPI0027DE6229|nr:DUF3311 domain-containing protein [Actinoplanes ovalisporus]